MQLHKQKQKPQLLKLKLNRHLK